MKASRAGTWSALLVAVALLATACGSGSKQACSQLDQAGTSEQTDSGAGETALLTGVQAESDDCVDRVTFDFRGDPGRPGYRVHYAPADQALVEDGSGRRIEAEGSAFLVVRLEPAATADISGEKLVFTYHGPRRLRPEGSRSMREIVKTGDFEAVVTWVIALREKRPFRAVPSSSPARLVVEIG